MCACVPDGAILCVRVCMCKREGDKCVRVCVRENEIRESEITSGVAAKRRKTWRGGGAMEEGEAAEER